MRNSPKPVVRTRDVIFCNKTLEALTRYQPVNTEEALHIPGIGAAKVQRYAASFLEAIRICKKSRKG
jgi:superfamily II DNA helicase RecQ